MTSNALTVPVSHDDGFNRAVSCASQKTQASCRPTRKSLPRLITSLALVFGAAACAPQSGTQDQAFAFRNAVAASDFAAASRIAGSLAGPTERRELLWSLNAGATALHQPDPAAATSFLDTAENNMTTVEGSNFNWNSTYRFGSYDAAMVNTYKAFAALSRGDRDGARVEINRAQERLQRIAERYRAEIAAARDNINAQQREDPTKGQSITAAQNAPEVQDLLRANAEWRAYQPFVNPASTYLRGIFLLNTGVPGDAEEARRALLQVQAVANSAPVVLQDIDLARQAANGRRPAPQVWVIFENGQSSEFEQLNFTVPMPVLARQGGVTVRPITVSMPRLAVRPNAYDRLMVTGRGPAVGTVPVASMRGVMASEYGARFNNLLAGAVLEAVAKAVGVSAANAVGSRMGAAGAILEIGAVAAANITVSDTRSWQALPGEFQAARVPTPSSGSISIAAPGGPSLTLSVPTGRSSIVLVKAQQPGSPLVAQVLPL